VHLKYMCYLPQEGNLTLLGDRRVRTFTSSSGLFVSLCTSIPRGADLSRSAMCVDGLAPHASHHISSSSTGVSEQAATTLKVNKGRSLYAFQVRAFLGALDVVDADVETVADILEGTQDIDVEGAGEEEDSSDSDHGNEDERSDISLPSEFEKEGEHDIGICSSIIKDCLVELAWSKQEVKAMMHHLKERGK
jgi:hypothetical protein